MLTEIDNYKISINNELTIGNYVPFQHYPFSQEWEALYMNTRRSSTLSPLYLQQAQSAPLQCIERISPELSTGEDRSGIEIPVSCSISTF